MAGKLEQVGKLLATADRFEQEGNTGAADAYRAKADALMFTHKIDEAMARATIDSGKPVLSGSPIRFVMDFPSIVDEFRDMHVIVAAAIARLCGVQLVFEGFDHVSVFGYQSDVDYFRMLWLSGHLAFSGKINPRWSTDLSEGHNIRLFAEAGYSWKTIWEEGRAAGALTSVPMPPADNGKMKRLARAAYKELGEVRQPVTQSRAKYRGSYAAGFEATMRERTTTLWYERERLASEAGDGVSLVLAKDATAIEDLINATYPDGLTYGTRQKAAPRELDPTALGKGSAVGRSVDL